LRAEGPEEMGMETRAGFGLSVHELEEIPIKLPSFRKEI